MNMNKTIILLTILIICMIGAVEAFLIFGGGEVIKLDTNSSVNNTTNDTNITDSGNTDNSGNNNPSTPDPEPNVEPEPPEEGGGEEESNYTP
ncbi:MAG: hypothetical protein LBU74_00775 [Methanobacteriaceae archaeon]|jgi:hypothetical protein|nr:hypothetical protein [Candidatus Methanorudis spinitermitis]